MILMFAMLVAFTFLELVLLYLLLEYCYGRVRKDKAAMDALNVLFKRFFFPEEEKKAEEPAPVAASKEVF